MLPASHGVADHLGHANPHRTNITMEWHQHDQRTGEDAISGGHKGPILVYAAKVPSGQTAATWDGSGAVWFKLYESGLISARYLEAWQAHPSLR